MSIPFKQILSHLEVRGWRLQRIWKPYRVFLRGRDELPILIEVNNGRVDRKAWEQIKKIAD
ncbi:MAG: hypothetical protein HUU19_16275 [Phycisphaerales bacterium]|nr:hypothetical protein [Phycisphaerales bacterium]